MCRSASALVPVLRCSREQAAVFDDPVGAGVAWQATASRPTFKGTTLEVEASRMDGPLTNKVRQSLTLYLPEFDGPGTYTAKRGSRFPVVGMKTGDESDPEMDRKK